MTALFRSERVVQPGGPLPRKNDPPSQTEDPSRLLSSPERFRYLVETVKDYAIFWLDPQGHISSWNTGAQRIKGYDAEDVLGKHIRTFYREEDRERGLPEQLLRLAEQEGSVEVEGWRVRKDGTEFWADVLITAIRSPEGQLLGFSKVTKDLTQRRAAESLLRDNLRAERAQNAILNLVHGDDDPLTKKRAIARAVAEAFDTTRTLLATKNADGSYVIEAGVDLRYPEHELAGVRLTSTATPGLHAAFEHVVERSEPAVVDDMLAGVADPEFRRLIEEIDIQSALYVPLRQKGRNIGVLGIAESRGPRPYGPPDVEIAKRLGEYAGLALHIISVTEQLRASEEKHRIVVEQVRDYAIMHLDPNGHITTWNEGARRIKGYVDDDVVGRHIEVFYTEEDRAAGRPQMLLAKARERGSVEDEGWRVRKDGSRFWADVIITRLRDPQGELVGFSKVTRDLTDRRRLERLREEQAATLRASNRQLEQFAYVASHDLQAPLRQITSFAQLLQRRLGDDLGPRETELVDNMVAAVEHMRDLVQSLLTHARVQRQELKKQPVPLADIIDAAAQNLALAFDENEATLRYGELPTVAADPTLLERVFQNLFQNSIRYRRDEPPVIRIEVAPGGPEDDEERMTTVKVHDNGQGFKPRYAERIFEMFHRLDPDGSEGMGIGLAMSRMIVERHGGSITAEGRPGVGATFTIRLPLADAPS